LELVVLFYGEDLLDPPFQGCRSRDQLTTESFHLPHAIVTGYLTPPDVLPQILHILHKIRHIAVHHRF
jgi:hypothetical protein